MLEQLPELITDLIYYYEHRSRYLPVLANILLVKDCNSFSCYNKIYPDLQRDQKYVIHMPVDRGSNLFASVSLNNCSEHRIISSGGYSNYNNTTMWWQYKPLHDKDFEVMIIQSNGHYNTHSFSRF